MTYVIVLITVASEDEAVKIVHRLLNDKLIACANIVKGVRSIFWWKGTIESSNEILVLMKTHSKLIKDVIKITKKLHSYEVPEITVIPIKTGYIPYLRWIRESIRKV
ncbi:MAG TPA: divalent-cation tolerance protein CutA [archaeon]|nr:divalent-cation tolerance protein CutA [archaeon]